MTDSELWLSIALTFSAEADDQRAAFVYHCVFHGDQRHQLDLITRLICDDHGFNSSQSNRAAIPRLTTHRLYLIWLRETHVSELHVNSAWNTNMKRTSNTASPDSI